MDKSTTKRSYVTVVGVGYGQVQELTWKSRKRAERHLREQRLSGRFGHMRTVTAVAQ